MSDNKEYILNKIEDLKYKVVNEVKRTNLNSPEIVKVSQKIDDLVFEVMEKQIDKN